VSVEDDDVLSRLDFCNGNDEANLKIPRKVNCCYAV
jgi:hypothetical protein